MADLTSARLAKIREMAGINIPRSIAWTLVVEMADEIDRLRAVIRETQDAVDEVHEKLALFIAMGNGRSPSRVGQLKDFQGLLKMHGLLPMPKEIEP